MSLIKMELTEDGDILCRHPFDGRPIRFMHGRLMPPLGGAAGPSVRGKAYLQLGDGESKSNHALPVNIRNRGNVDGKFGLTEREAIDVVCAPKFPKTPVLVRGKPIQVGIGRRGPYISYNQVYMNVTTPPTYGAATGSGAATSTSNTIFNMNSTELKGLLRNLSAAVSGGTQQQQHEATAMLVSETETTAERTDSVVATTGTVTAATSAVSVSAEEPTSLLPTMGAPVVASTVSAGLVAQNGNGRVAKSSLVTPNKKESVHALPDSVLSDAYKSKVQRAFHSSFLASMAHGKTTHNGLGHNNNVHYQYQCNLLCRILHARWLHHCRTSSTCTTIATTTTTTTTTLVVHDFYRLNLGRIAVAMITMNHILPFDDLLNAIDKPDLCLLLAVDDESKRSHFVRLGPTVQHQLQGCYLMHHVNYGFLGSRNVVGRSFLDRFQEHQIMAMRGGGGGGGSSGSSTLSQPTRTQLTQPSSQSDDRNSSNCSSSNCLLYTKFPSRFSTYEKRAMGLFEEVEFYSGLSFPLQNPDSSLYATEADKSLFVWEASLMDTLRQQVLVSESFTSGPVDDLATLLQTAQLQLVAGLSELVYSLALGSNHTLGTQLGYEWPFQPTNASG